MSHKYRKMSGMNMRILIVMIRHSQQMDATMSLNGKSKQQKYYYSFSLDAEKSFK